MAECKDPQVIIDSTLQFIRKSRSTDKAVSGTYNTDDYKNEVVSRLLKIRGEGWLTLHCHESATAQ